MGPRVLAIALAVMAVACQRTPAGVQGRWERVGQPTEWVLFAEDRTFTGRSYMEPAEIRGTYEQRGDTVRATSTYGRTQTLVLRDSLLVMGDGARYRRALRKH
ncbi:MAG TPA: hypothetical protein VGB92_18460 [Longimicrobium sp.]